jgi:hypothetical protein
MLTPSSPAVLANWTDRGRFKIKAYFVDEAGAKWQLFLRSVAFRLACAFKGLNPTKGKETPWRTGDLMEDSESYSNSGSDSNSESEIDERFDL